MHVSPLTSDGIFTIGYDADGCAGKWPGNMSESTLSENWVAATEGDTFSDSWGVWDSYIDGEELVWRDPAGNWISPRALLLAYGDI